MIKTWQQRCEEHPDHNGIVSDEMIWGRMQEEIDELRAAIEVAQQPVAVLHRNTRFGILRVEYTDEITELDDGVFNLYAKPQEKKDARRHTNKQPSQG